MGRYYDYDLIVIGGGIAGMVSAVTANGLGKCVAVVEKSRIGGNCTNTTCIPSKALISLSHISRDIKQLKRFGLLSDTQSGVIGGAVMPHIRGIVKKAYEKDLPETFAEIGIDIIHASAKFIDSHSIEADGKKLTASKFIIASGTSPFIPPVEGLNNIEYLTNETLYQIDDLPESLIILGGGVDGLEYASAFGLLGVKTTVVEMATRLLPMVDFELVRCLMRTMRAEGIRLLSGARAVRFFSSDNKIMLSVEHKDGSKEDIAADRVIVAVGRKPDLQGLSLENAGVEYNQRGIIADSRLKTSADNIYACGDIAGPYQLASTAEAQAIIAATNAFLPVKQRVDYNNNVYVVFTNPPIAYLGLTEEQAYAEFERKLKAYRFDYTNMRRAVIDGKNIGIAKILCDGRGRIVGAHIVGENAAEVIHEIQAIKAFNKPLYSLNIVTHAYPTYAQALVGRAGQLAFLDRMQKNIFVKIALGVLPGYANRLNLARERLAETGPSQSNVKTQKYDETFKEGQKTYPDKDFDESNAPDKVCIIKSTPSESGFITVDIKGLLNKACEASFYLACKDAFEQGRNILLNFSDTEHIDMEGAGILVKCASLASRKHILVEAAGVKDDVRDLFRLTHLDKAIFVRDNNENLPDYPSDKVATVSGWAASIDYLSVSEIPKSAMNINVNGRRVTSPVIGFGRLWDKKYRLSLNDNDVSPQEIITLWKSEFPSFWPKGNTVFTSGKAQVAPGTQAVLNLSIPGGLKLATGIMVVYADDTSFGFMTIEGHMLSGWITFSSFYEGKSVIVQVHPLFRASDPLMELSFRLGAAKQEDMFWHGTLNNIARRLGSHGNIEQKNTLIDEHINWNETGNIWKNAAIRSSFYMPLYILKRIFNTNKQSEGLA